MTRACLEAAVLAGMDRAERDVMRWGVDDCALWAASIVKDALGYDPVAAYRGRYHSRFGAMRYISANGGMDGLLKSAARRHGWKRIDPRWAKPGDVGLVWTPVKVPSWRLEKTDDFDADGSPVYERVQCFESVPVLATAICRTRGWFVARNECGWSAIKADAVAAAWSVLDDVEFGSPVNLHSQIRGMPQPVHDPISIAILTVVGIEATTAAVAITSFLLTTALSIGFSLVSSMLQPHTGLGSLGDSSFSSVQASVQVTERQSLPYKQVIVGNAYVGPKLFFEQVKPPYLTMGGLLSVGPISGVRSITIGTDKLAFSSIAENTILTPLGIDGQPNYPNRFRCCVRYGSATQATDPLILARYASIGSSFQQLGIATYVGEYHFGTDQNDFIATWGQVSRPNAYISADGVLCYDPRDPTQLLADESTWKWTNNASLIQAFYLTRDWGGRIPTSKIDWAKVADAANYDDEVVGCKDGTFIKRYTVDGVIILNEKPYNVLPKLLSANRGYVLAANGKVWVSSSRPKTPVATINDRIIAGGFQYQAAKAKRDLLNKGQVRFVAEEQDYQIVDGPILDRTDLQAIDQEVLPGTLTLEYTRDHRRAQRLLKAYIDSSRLGKTVQVPVDASILAIAGDELIGNAVNFDSVLWPTMNRTYLVTGLGMSDDLATVSLALVEYDASIENAWDPAVDEKEFTLATVNVS